MVGQSWVGKGRVGSGREGKGYTCVSGSMEDRRL